MTDAPRATIAHPGDAAPLAWGKSFGDSPEPDQLSRMLDTAITRIGEDAADQLDASIALLVRAGVPLEQIEIIHETGPGEAHAGEAFAIVTRTIVRQRREDRA